MTALRVTALLVTALAFAGCGDDAPLNPGGSSSRPVAGSGGMGAAGGMDGTGATGGTGGSAAVDDNPLGFVDPSWGPGECPDGGDNYGTKVGDTLGSVTLKTCEGEDFSLDALCGADATWIFVAHGWCPRCRAATKLAEALHDEFQANGSNIATVNILIEDTQQRPPDGDDCAGWRGTYGHEDVITLYDPKGTMMRFWEEQYTALSLFVSGDRVITGKAHTDQDAGLRSGIETALAQ